MRISCFYISGQHNSYCSVFLYCKCTFTDPLLREEKRVWLDEYKRPDERRGILCIQICANAVSDGDAVLFADPAHDAIRLFPFDNNDLQKVYKCVGQTLLKIKTLVNTVLVKQ